MDRARETIRGKLRNGTLRRDGHEKMWAGNGEGRTCDGCGLLIGRAEIEVELEFSEGSSLRLHNACFAVWVAERLAVPGADRRD
jgi:hypothetical protein